MARRPRTRAAEGLLRVGGAEPWPQCNARRRRGARARAAAGLSGAPRGGSGLACRLSRPCRHEPSSLSCESAREVSVTAYTPFAGG
eukprot:scaffold49636_cov27-Phaeocystis_antarctica.AAC.1